VEPVALGLGLGGALVVEVLVWAVLLALVVVSLGACWLVFRLVGVAVWVSVPYYKITPVGYLLIDLFIVNCLRPWRKPYF